MPKIFSARTYTSRQVRRSDRILLINPPVEETRYSWIRWNQPLDLLKIGAWLRTELGCAVELLDFMKPDRDGRVVEGWLPGAGRYRIVGGERHPMRRFGLPYKTLDEWVFRRRATSLHDLPTQVWITSLCSYWTESVAQLSRRVKDLLPDAQLVVLGQAPRLVLEHLKSCCVADVLITKPLDLDRQAAALDLYGEELPPFLALRLKHPETAIEEVRDAIRKGVVNFTFFEEDITIDEGQALETVIAQTRDLHRHLRFHVICGLCPSRMTPSLAKLMANPKLFAAVHFEEQDVNGDLDIEAYMHARQMLGDAGMRPLDGRLSGFVWIGRPGDDLEKLVLRSFQVLNLLGGLILKPFTPLPGGPEHCKFRKALDGIPLPEWSPHFFPLADLNCITRAEYHDLYRLAAFLNERVRSRPFDFLAGTLGADLLRESLKREVWKLEPSPLRIID